MNAIIANGYGGPEVFEFTQVEKPIAKENEVIVKVYASSATRADGMIRSGKPYFGRLMTGISKPKNPIPGTGFAGIIESAGKSITKFKEGDRVFGETTLGFSANAEFVAVPENGVIANMPENMQYTEAAGFCDGALTSINFLKNIAGLKAGQKALINGASGSLGTTAVQIAKIMGAEVIAVCSTKNIGLVKSLEADHVIDYTKTDYTQLSEKYDIVYDTVGTNSYSRSKKVLKEDGQYISPVLSLSLFMHMLRTSLFSKKRAKFSATGLLKENDLRTLLSELINYYKEGKLKMVIDRQYPLEKLAEAHTYIASGHKKGNVIIINQN